MRRHTLALFLMLSAALPGLARKPGDTIKPGWNLFSKQQDMQLGQQAARQIVQQYQIVDNREMQEYVTRIGKRLAAVKEADEYPYTFTVVNDKSINAFALPGGPTFVHTGLLAAADNEAQVAGVLAHEISHVALRHGTNQASKANLLQIPALIAGVATGNNLWASLIQIGATGMMLKFSRTAESQADLLGTQIMAKAGYNPVEMARFFEKLEAEGGSRAPQFLSDHPNPGNRVKAVEEEVRGLPRGAYNANAGDFSAMKRLSLQYAGGARPGSPQQSASPSAPPAAPSGSMKQLQGREFALSYPGQWEVFGDNNSASFTIAPRQGIVQGRNGAQIGYGAMVSYFFPKDTRGKGLKDYTNELIHNLHSQNPSMQLSSQNQRKLKIDGNQALISMMQSESPFPGRTEVDMLLTVERPEGVLYMVCIAPDKEFRDVQRTFEDMIQSVRFSN
jgi:Zn-dependent protease with chaperone function